MINNRQAGRRRGRGGNNGGNGGNGPRQGGQGRGDNGNRIDSRARGNANQLYEKYKNLAADAQRQGDRVNTEYYLQFADHYFRVLSDQRGRFEEQQPRRQQFDDNDGDEEFGDEGEPIRSGEQAEAPRNDRPQREAREPRQYNDRPQGERQNGAERPRRWEREERAPRQRENEAEVGGQHRADPVVPGEDLVERAEQVIAADAPLGVEQAPRRRGRPRRDAAPVIDAPVSNGGGESVSNGFEADRLPPALNVAMPANDADGDGDAPKPRRRRARAAAATDVAAD
ncbi:DUF4167 domain-containing protein [Sphingomonas sp. KR1UV-12]|uniref:DUF4167 domain-containing protein n=1 Tax=Sphingomonas aurea TaxID=3063994 RepID=A0ABT9ENN8_9SPHN|nr:DUF4167 domain-containing protein [Sphingomonas sp. KR1UV-12]MDP1028572.1 DUF4167 domain-containing protein [Sphingomonas sp. KR1UV-12]